MILSPVAKYSVMPLQYCLLDNVIQTSDGSQAYTLCLVSQSSGFLQQTPEVTWPIYPTTADVKLKHLHTEQSNVHQTCRRLDFRN